mmetsp:Transcript_25934/g.48697  ORF Transcript_25934/g.48697 Transcript_25934/m.48697 type:complete len:321 (+) Transcript_25934:643-1605(+)
MQFWRTLRNVMKAGPVLRPALVHLRHSWHGIKRFQEGVLQHSLYPIKDFSHLHCVVNVRDHADSLRTDQLCNCLHRRGRWSLRGRGACSLSSIRGPCQTHLHLHLPLQAINKLNVVICESDICLNHTVSIRRGQPLPSSAVIARTTNTHFESLERAIVQQRQLETSKDQTSTLLVPFCGSLIEVPLRDVVQRSEKQLPTQAEQHGMSTFVPSEELCLKGKDPILSLLPGTPAAQGDAMTCSSYRYCSFCCLYLLHTELTLGCCPKLSDLSQQCGRLRVQVASAALPDFLGCCIQLLQPLCCVVRCFVRQLSISCTHRRHQ